MRSALYRIAIASGLFLGLAFGGAAPARAQGVVVIVHGENDVEAVSAQDLSRIYKLSRRRWPNGTPISLYLPAPSTEPAQLLATRLLNVGSEADMFSFYLRAIFRQQITAVPETLPASPVAIERVAAEPGAIALIERDMAPSGGRVRVIEVDGL